MIVNLNDWIDAGKSAQMQAPASGFKHLNELFNGTLEPVVWHIGCSRQATTGAAYDSALEPYQRFLHIRATTQGHIVCSRCLNDLAVKLDVDTVLQVFQTDEGADEWAMSEHADTLPDPIVASRQFDLQAQVEEELLLALDVHAVHDPLCELPSNQSTGKPSPFAVLAALKV